MSASGADIIMSPEESRSYYCHDREEVGALRLPYLFPRSTLLLSELRDDMLPTGFQTAHFCLLAKIPVQKECHKKRQHLCRIMIRNSNKRHLTNRRGTTFIDSIIKLALVKKEKQTLVAHKIT